MSCAVVLAHPGRTDSQGGHYNRETGEYHFHNGDSANKKNNTSKNNYNYSYYYEDYSSTNKNNVVANNDSNTNKEDNELRAFWWITIIFVILSFVAIFIIKAIYNNKLNELNSTIYRKKNEITCLQDKLETIQQEYVDAMVYANKSIYEITSIPHNVDIAVDGTPKLPDVYVSGNRARTFHGGMACRGTFRDKCSFYSVSRLHACHYCAPEELKTFGTWFPDYAEKLNYLAKYNVPIKEHIEYDRLSSVVKNYHWYLPYGHSYAKFF